MSVVDAVGVTRRARLRAQTVVEIKQRALAQLLVGGVESLSLNAIARSMEMSGPALYRYFASRDELMAELVTDGYNDMSDALQLAASAAAEEPVGAQLRAVVGAYRSWALAEPHRYRLLFATDYGSGQALAAPGVYDSADRAMTTILLVLSRLPVPATPTPGVSAELQDQVHAWAASYADFREELPADILGSGILLWTRLHGILTLEIAGFFASMQIDAAGLCEAEVVSTLGRHA